jgi:ribA/ribD-fused uncharacterized protein
LAHVDLGEGPCDVVNFYGHAPGKPYCELSNFYVHAPFDFELPLFCKKEGFDQVTPCEFSEKAIMLCKAAVFNDLESFKKIQAAPDNRKAKALGRKVKKFDEYAWDKYVVPIAESVIYQKFTKVPKLKNVLLSTG